MNKTQNKNKAAAQKYAEEIVRQHSAVYKHIDPTEVTTETVSAAFNGNPVGRLILQINEMYYPKDTYRVYLQDANGNRYYETTFGGER